MNSFRFMLISVVIGLLAGCAATPPSTPTSTPAAKQAVKPGTGKVKIKPFEVKLEVLKNTRGDIVLENKNDKTANCDKFPNEDKFRKGCLVADVNDIMNVQFKLSGSGNWHFAEFQICSTADVTQKSDFDTCGLSPEQMAEWIVITNAGSALPTSSGKVDISALESKPRKFNLVDLNLTVADYFYQVCVKQTDESCDVPGTCVCTDPGGVNKGRF